MGRCFLGSRDGVSFSGLFGWLGGVFFRFVVSVVPLHSFYIDTCSCRNELMEYTIG